MKESERYEKMLETITKDNWTKAIIFNTYGEKCIVGHNYLLDHETFPAISYEEEEIVEYEEDIYEYMDDTCPTFIALAMEKLKEQGTPCETEKAAPWIFNDTHSYEELMDLVEKSFKTSYAQELEQEYERI